MRLFSLVFRVPLCWLLLFVGGLQGLSAQAQVAAFTQAQLVGTPVGSFDRTALFDLAVDAAGNAYVTGSFTGTARFGSFLLTTPAAQGNFSLTAAYVAKIDPAGNYLWAVQSTGAPAMGTSLVLDPAGNATVAGVYGSGTVAFGNVSLANRTPGNTPPALHPADVFVARLDARGNWLGATSAGGPGNDLVNDLASDPAGNLYLTGTYTDSPRFGSTVLPAAPNARPKMFVARLTPPGTWRWAVHSSGALDEAGAAVAADARGHVFVAGTTDSPTTSFGALSLPGPSGFVARLDSSGIFQWVVPSGHLRGQVNQGGYQIGVGTGTRRLDLALDGAGNLYLAGAYNGASARFGTTVLTNSTGVTTEGVVARMDPGTGAFRWAVPVRGNPAGTSLYEACSRLAIDARDQVYVTGTFNSSSVVFGATVVQNPNANGHIFLANLDPQGNWSWVLPGFTSSVGITSFHSGHALAISPAGEPVLGGVFGSTLRLGPTLALQGNYVAQGFLARAQAGPSLLVAGDTVVCNGGQVQLRAVTTGTVTGYRWSTGATTAAITVTQPGTYSVTVTFAGGIAQTLSYRVQALTPVLAIGASSPRLCPGAAVTLQATFSGAPALRWSTGSASASITVTQPGTYTLTATYSSGCQATARHEISANALAITGRLQLCPGQGTTLTATATGAAVVSYRWNTGATTPTLRVGQAGTYTVGAVLADGCVVTARHTVGPPRAVVASVSGDTLLCPGTQLQLTALNSDALTYRWNTGATTPTVPVTAPGTYAVLLTYEGGCTSRDSLQVYPAPVAPAFTLGPDTTLCLEQPLRLQAPAFEGPGVVRRWSDGSSGPSLLVREPGTYSLQFTTPCGTRTASRRVAYASCLRIPNVITPNNDQRNDRFVVEGLTQGDWDLTLYTRWGKQVYHAAAYRHDWGGDAAPGTYYYLLRNATTNVMHKGWLEVIR